MLPCAVTIAGEPVTLRINTSHGLENAQGAVIDTGLTLAKDIKVTPSSVFNGRPFLPPDTFIADAEAMGATLLASSFSGWNYTFDPLLYIDLTQRGMMHVYAYEPRLQQPHNAPPPASFATVNMIGGKSGPGIEFGVPKNYMGGKGQGDTPSAVTAQLAGLMAAIKYHHPQWNWFDVKAALRSTATNFTTGYRDKQYGYGTIDYLGANSLQDATTLPLFPPAAVVRRLHENRISFAVNSFKQTRRIADALFKFRMPPAPMLQELTLKEISALGGQLLFTGDLSTKTNTLTLQVPGDETAYFVWLSKDMDGKYSRIEPYSIIGPVSISTKKRPLYGPRLGKGI